MAISHSAACSPAGANGSSRSLHPGTASRLRKNAERAAPDEATARAFASSGLRAPKAGTAVLRQAGSGSGSEIAAFAEDKQVLVSAGNRRPTNGTRGHAAGRRSMKRAPLVIGIAAIVFIAGIAGSAAVLRIRAPENPTAIEPVWSEVKWPFLQDQWGIGKAFVCLPADCGVKIDVFIRPKIGFCNCSTGVSDDNELERVADTDLVSPKVRPAGPASPVKIGWMRGLSRPYRVSDEKPNERLLSVAFNDECDVVVALASLGKGDPAVVAPAVISFLNSTPMVLWAKKELGLEFVRREW